MWLERTSTASSAVGPELPLRERVLRTFELSPTPLSQVALRTQLRVRNQLLTEVLRELSEEGLLERSGVREGWSRSGV